MHKGRKILKDAVEMVSWYIIRLNKKFNIRYIKKYNIWKFIQYNKASIYSFLFLLQWVASQFQYHLRFLLIFDKRG